MQTNMAGNAKTSLATQSLCKANESEDYSDIYNVSLYNLVPSRKIDPCTFFTQQTYDEITKLLRAENSFKPNAPGRVAQSVGHLTRKSGVLGSIPGLATYFRFSFRFFKKGSCQLLVKVCARSTG